MLTIRNLVSIYAASYSPTSTHVGITCSIWHDPSDTASDPYTWVESQLGCYDGELLTKINRKLLFISPDTESLFDVKQVVSLGTDWFRLGLALGLSYYTLEAIASTHR